MNGCYIPTKDELEKILIDNLIDPSMLVEDAYTITDEQEMAVALAVIDLMIEKTEGPYLEVLNKMKAEGEIIKELDLSGIGAEAIRKKRIITDEGMRKRRIEAIKRKIGYDS